MALDGRAVLILGPSGAGKTTLALALVADGASLYSDECLFVDKQTGVVAGLARSLMIREPALDVLSCVPGLAAACAGGPVSGSAPKRLWYAVDPDDVFGRNVAAAPARLGAVLVLEERTRGVPAMTALPDSMAAVMIAQRAHVKDAGLADLARAAGTLAGAACYRVRLGAPADTAALVRATLA